MRHTQKHLKPKPYPWLRQHNDNTATSWEPGTMRTTFVITPDLELHSAVRPRVEPHALRIGDAIVLAQPFDTPYGVVPAGSKGFVSYLYEDDGTCEVFMEGIIPALFQWNNVLVLSPFTCEDLVVRTRLSLDKMPSVPADGTMGQVYVPAA